MNNCGRILLALAAFLCTAAITTAARALSFEPDNIYTTSYSSRTILQYDVDGAIVDSLTIAPEHADELKGLAFGPDGLLYVTAVRSSEFAVLALDEAGQIQETYPGNVSVRGNLSYGKLALDEEYLYVAGLNQLTRFDLADPNSATTIYTENQVFDVKILSTGNLIVASAYLVAEITSDGAHVRTIGSSTLTGFTDVRGVEYDEATNKVFVTHLGHSGFFFRLMRLDGSTGALEDDTQFGYADDLFLMSSGDILVGSRTETPSIYSQALEAVTELEEWDVRRERMFVTQYVDPESSIVVSVDIRPWSDINDICPFASYAIPVAILGSETFDVADVDATTLAFGPNEAAPMSAAGGYIQDVNEDGLMDLLSYYRTQETGIAMGDTEACVTGETLDGVLLEGCDMVNTQPPGFSCGIGFELAFLLPPLLWLHERRRRSIA